MKAQALQAMEKDGKPAVTDIKAAMQTADRRRSPPVMINFNFHAPVIIGPEISVDALIAYLRSLQSDAP